MTNAVEKAWSLLKQRDYPSRQRTERGVANVDGVIAYPTGPKGGSLKIDQDLPENTRAPDAMGVFRNISNPAFYAPGKMPDGSVRDDAAVLSLEQPRGTTIAVANAVPMLNPRFNRRWGAPRWGDDVWWTGEDPSIIDPKTGKPKKVKSGWGQARSIVTAPGRGRPWRSRHMNTEGELPRELIRRLMQGEDPTRLIEIADGFFLSRNQFGDAVVNYRRPDGLVVPAPYVSYNWADLVNPRLPASEGRFDLPNLKFRQDHPTPWRAAQGHIVPEGISVTGSVDPLLRIPVGGVGPQHIQYTDRSGHTFAGVPIPPRFAVSRGIATGAHGLYFNPQDILPESRDIFSQAIGGNIVQYSDDALDSAWLIIKMD